MPIEAGELTADAFIFGVLLFALGAGLIAAFVEQCDPPLHELARALASRVTSLARQLARQSRGDPKAIAAAVLARVRGDAHRLAKASARAPVANFERLDARLEKACFDSAETAARNVNAEQAAVDQAPAPSSLFSRSWHGIFRR